MELLHVTNYVVALLPALLMLGAVFVPRLSRGPVRILWAWFNGCAIAALVMSVVSLGLELVLAFQPEHRVYGLAGWWLAPNLFGCWVGLLVQFLGVVIGIFSAHHLRGERRQGIYIAALAAVLTSVHFLLLANHWVALILAWAAIGLGMHRLLTYYPEREFAQLAAHKKRVADRLADVLLIIAAILAWHAAGTGSLSELFVYIGAGHVSPALVVSAVLLALAVTLRTALLPVHGWLIQVMEAPTPVSALLHAGVVNLGGYVLVFFAPLLGVSDAARWWLVVVGLASAVLGGTVMLTRVSIKVHLAWSTLAQMGFMLLECGLGLYLFAALHLIGHSLYKAHSFLSASTAVRNTRILRLYGYGHNTAASMFAAPLVSLGVVMLGQHALADLAWPWWWSGVLALAWASLLWLPRHNQGRHFITGLVMTVGFTIAAFVVEYLPLGAGVAPFTVAGPLAFAGMLFMYGGFVALQLWPDHLIGIRHWIYAGFYLDEIYTVLALRLWPKRWARAPGSHSADAHLALHTGH